LPERVAAVIPAKQRRDHQRLAERLDEAGREIARLKAAITEAPSADHIARSEAALAGKEELPERTEPRIRQELEDAIEVHAALDAALRRSADSLLATAQPAAAALADELEGELRDGAEAVRARLAELEQELSSLGDLHSTAAWTRFLAGASGQTVSPFRAGHSAAFTETAGQIRTTAAALAFDLDRLEGRRRDAEAQAEQNAQWSAEREQATE
jgi:hypothetical protein